MKQPDHYATDLQSDGLPAPAGDGDHGHSIVPRSMRGDTAYPNIKDPNMQYHYIYLALGAATKKYRSKDGREFQNCGLWVATGPNEGVRDTIRSPLCEGFTFP